MQFQVGTEFHIYSHKTTHYAHSLKGFTIFFLVVLHKMHIIWESISKARRTSL